MPVGSASRWRVGALLLVVGAAGAGLSLALARGGSLRLDSQPRQSEPDRLQPVAAEAKADPPIHLPTARSISMPKPNVPPGAEGRKSGVGFGNDHPGASALRAESDWYCEYNRKAIDEQARREGLTTDEVKELTFLGFMALKTTQPVEVQKVLGRELSTEERNRLGAILSEENEGFKTTMRLKVKEGASLEERWKTIRDFESYYVHLFNQVFGMTGAQFDQMLATNPDSRIGASPVPLPAQVPTPPPEQPRPAPPQVPIGDPSRKPDPTSG